jgi:superfamily I DNA and/or RNA helicase
VIICEEAAEVLEAHMLSTFMQSVQHLIQIGDHEQLRPQVTNFRLFSLESNKGKQYQLDRSLFERLAKGSLGKPCIPITQLTIQRRMRPEISRLIRDTLYPRLVDHPVTKILPAVAGMRKNVFWYHHTEPEVRVQDTTRGKSHSNDAEVCMTHALVRHIIRQGVYKSGDIAVLTPYAGQLRKLQMKLCSSFELILSQRDQDELANTMVEKMRPSLEEGHRRDSEQAFQKYSAKQFLRIATVDNFQGEEAKIIVISLVRSNTVQDVGFLRTTNRINVLLSRAKHGMYLIGNAGTYAHIPMWSKVLDVLRETESVGEAFSLCCPRHPETGISVSKPEDFDNFSPEGGCEETCNR